ncbi:MAG TPA: hypothetical protein VFM18_04575 [Methanosarcina sp.]|nr:hypothetical protein [Methanosarcina sp.]
MPRYNLDQLLTKAPQKYTKDDFRRSREWFAEQAKKLGDRVSRTSVMNTPSRHRASFMPGKMYLFQYFPKGAKELPYYDMLPLVIPFSADEETFTGLNFHYLPYKVRYVLLKNLLDFATNPKLDEKTRLKMSWQFVGGISKYRGANSAVKKYRLDHMQSTFIEIPANQWFMALLLPIENFNHGENAVYMDKNYVWQQSMKYL